jgi:hypothetical protein
MVRFTKLLTLHLIVRTAVAKASSATAVAPAYRPEWERRVDENDQRALVAARSRRLDVQTFWQ